MSWTAMKRHIIKGSCKEGKKEAERSHHPRESRHPRERGCRRMDYLHLSVIPAKAGIHWLQVLRDPCLRRDDGKFVFFDTLESGCR